MINLKKKKKKKNYRPKLKNKKFISEKIDEIFTNTGLYLIVNRISKKNNIEITNEEIILTFELFNKEKIYVKIFKFNRQFEISFSNNSYITFYKSKNSDTITPEFLKLINELLTTNNKSDFYYCIIKFYIKFISVIIFNDIKNHIKNHNIIYVLSLQCDLDYFISFLSKEQKIQVNNIIVNNFNEIYF